MAAVTQEEEFRVIVGDEDPDSGQTHYTHLDESKNTNYKFRAPISYARKFAMALLFDEGYMNLGLLVRIQRKMESGQWIDHD